MPTPTFGGLLVALAALSLAFGLLERLWPDLGARRDPASRRTDLAYWLLSPFVNKAIDRASLVLAVAAMLALAGLPVSKDSAESFIASRGEWAAGLPRGLQFALSLAALDFLGYWQHRLFHGRTLWKFHAVHHGSAVLDWMSAARVHPVNELVGRLLQLVPLIWFGFPLQALAGAVPLLTLYAIFLHADLPWDFGPLRYAVATPRFHRWHHTSQEEGLDKNFAGLFPAWDLLFGTFYMPPGRRPERFGVAGEPVPEGWLAQLAYPFRR